MSYIELIKRLWREIYGKELNETISFSDFRHEPLYDGKDASGRYPKPDPAPEVRD